MSHVPRQGLRRPGGRRPSRPRLERLEPRHLPATFTVINVNDAGTGSLRQAILDADNQLGASTILFAIPGAGVHTIAPASALPTIIVPLTIDGTSQPSYAGKPMIELNGSGAGAGSPGLTIRGSGSVVAGLDIDRFSGPGIFVNTASGVRIVSNYIGTDSSGLTAEGNGSYGIELSASPNALIGGAVASARNVIAANGQAGLYVVSTTPTPAPALVEGNYFGTDATGEALLSNDGDIVLSGGGGTSIGGTATGQGNLISSASNQNIDIIRSTGNVVRGNLVGLDAAGTTALARGTLTAGIIVEGGSTANTIGGTTSSARNAVMPGSMSSIVVQGTGTAGNLVGSNFVGTDAAGVVALRTLGQDGIRVWQGATGNTVGPGNVVSGWTTSAAAGPGISIQGVATKGNLVFGNDVGVDASGVNPLGFVQYGVSIVDGSGNTVGGASTLGRNVMSGGVSISSSSSAGSNLVLGNYIGVDSSGSKALTNGTAPVGIEVVGSNSNTIGGVGLAGNVVAGSGLNVGIELSAAAGNLVSGNLVGVAANGQSALGTRNYGVEVDNGSTSNTIGGTLAGAGNTLSASLTAGAYLTGPGTTGNLFLGDRIGLASTGSLAIPNGGPGVQIDGGASANAIGGVSPGAGNLIEDNRGAGIRVLGSSTIGNTLRGNTILGNTGLGIDLVGGTEDVYGVTANSPGGPHSGPNDLQNYPVLTSVTRTTSAVTVAGTLDSNPNSTFVVDLYGLTSLDPSGHGQASSYLGSVNVATDGSGLGSFRFKTGTGVASVTATATSPDGSTSEFALDSAPLVITQSHSTTLVPGGASLVFILFVKNSGTAPLPGVTLVDPAYPGAGNITTSTTQGSVAVTGGVVTYDIGTIAPGAQVVLTLRETITGLNFVTNIARVTFPVGAQIISQSGSYTVPGDYDGDGKADPAVYIADIGTFAYRPSGGGGDVVQPFGPAGQSVGVVGDFDGQGKDNLAVFIPSTATWAYRPSDGSADVIQSFGPAGRSIPVPGDYDGDGKADLAVYIPDIGVFAYRPSTGGPDVVIPFGAANRSIFIPGDYDGSGKTELAVYVPDLAEFIYRPANGGPDVVQTFGPGGARAIAAPGDYDGSGKTEIAVYIPDIGVYAYRPANGGPDVVVPFGPGGNRSIAVPGDYDGDGKTDLAVYIPDVGVLAYRPSGGGPDVVVPFGPGGGRSSPLLKSSGYNQFPSGSTQRQSIRIPSGPGTLTAGSGSGTVSSGRSASIVAVGASPTTVVRRLVRPPVTTVDNRTVSIAAGVKAADL